MTNTDEHVTETSIAAGVEELRGRFPRTQDLYREVCVLLFFRHGVTPTANKLYQLVRKGSMSAPTEALSHFWKTLRERSRVSIDHADLPGELRIAAGDLVATLWKSAQSKSLESLAALQANAAIAVDSAKADLASAQLAHAEVLQLVGSLHLQLETNQNDASQLREAQAAATAVREGLEIRLKEARGDLEAAQARQRELNSQHIEERQQLTDRARLAEERFADMEKRALQEIDRERMAAAKLQRAMETERATHIAALERTRVDTEVARAKSTELREQISALQNAVDILKSERDRDRLELQSVRTQLEAAVRQSVADSARADYLRDELERQQIKAQPAQSRTPGPNAKTKRRSKQTP